MKQPSFHYLPFFVRKYKTSRPRRLPSPKRSELWLNSSVSNIFWLFYLFIVILSINHKIIAFTESLFVNQKGNRKLAPIGLSQCKFHIKPNGSCSKHQATHTMSHMCRLHTSTFQSISISHILDHAIYRHTHKNKHGHNSHIACVLHHPIQTPARSNGGRTIKNSCYADCKQNSCARPQVIQKNFQKIVWAPKHCHFQSVKASIDVKNCQISDSERELKIGRLISDLSIRSADWKF